MLHWSIQQGFHSCGQHFHGKRKLQSASIYYTWGLWVVKYFPLTLQIKHNFLKTQLTSYNTVSQSLFVVNLPGMVTILWLIIRTTVVSSFSAGSPLLLGEATEHHQIWTTAADTKCCHWIVRVSQSSSRGCRAENQDVSNPSLMEKRLEKKKCSGETFRVQC